MPRAPLAPSRAKRLLLGAVLLCALFGVQLFTESPRPLLAAPSGPLATMTLRPQAVPPRPPPLPPHPALSPAAAVPAQGSRPVGTKPPTAGLRSPTEPTTHYTVVVPSTPKRADNLQSVVDQYTSCPHVERVLVVWGHPDVAPPSLQSTNPNVDVRTLVFRDTPLSLNNRFNLTGVESSSAIFSVDDDVEIGCDGVEFLFSVWQWNQDAIVGTTPRMLREHPDGSVAYEFPTPQFHEFSMVLTGVAFLHRRFLDAYTHQVDPAVRALVDQQHSCEDLAMNFVVTNITSRPPIFARVKHGFSSAHKSGLSKHTRGYYSERAKCVTALRDLFGPRGLKTSRVQLAPL